MLHDRLRMWMIVLGFPSGHWNNTPFHVSRNTISRLCFLRIHDETDGSSSARSTPLWHIIHLHQIHSFLVYPHITPADPSPKYLSPTTGCSSRTLNTAAISSGVSETSTAERFSAVRLACLIFRPCSQWSSPNRWIKRWPESTYEEPGNGTTCDPREETQAMENWAGLTFFFCAKAASSFTMATLFSHAWTGEHFSGLESFEVETKSDIHLPWL